MGPIGVQEMIAIFVLALLLFGPKKLPELGRMLGKGLSEFRRAKNELKSTFETHLRELEKETQLETLSATADSDYSAPYQHPYDDYGRYDTESVPSADSQAISESHEAAASELSTASATAPQDAEAHRDYSSSLNPPVSGTVPRSNGVQPVEPVSTVPVSPAVEVRHPV